MVVIGESSAADAVHRYLQRRQEIGPVVVAQVDRAQLVLQTADTKFFFESLCLGENTLVTAAIIAILVAAGFGAVQREGLTLTDLLYLPNLSSLTLSKEAGAYIVVTRP